MEKREQLGSRLGFIMLSAGCAIGCGNVWKFPWMCGQNGGGSFMLVYVICLLILGLPAMVMELSVGRAAQTSPLSVRLVFADFNQNYSLMGIIVRKVVIGENKIVYGCRLGVRNANLEQYISQKQRQMLSMNHGNSAFQNKEILEKALKEPGRADRTTQEDEPDDKNYKKKQIKNDGTYKERDINKVGKTERRDIFRDTLERKKV